MVAAALRRAWQRWSPRVAHSVRTNSAKVAASCRGAWQRWYPRVAHTVRTISTKVAASCRGAWQRWSPRVTHTLRTAWSKRVVLKGFVTERWRRVNSTVVATLRERASSSRVVLTRWWRHVRRGSAAWWQDSRASWRTVVLGIALLALVGVSVAVGVHSTTTTTTTTTTVPLSRPQAGWTVASESARGVMVDYRDMTIGGATFRVLRLRARTTLLRWHDGYEDPPASAGEVPVDAGSSIDWSNEGPAGVVAVFNGAFKKSADAGGAVVDGVTLEPLVVGDMTIVLSAEGHWSIGVWGAKGFPAKGFDPIAYRQNLGPLIEHGKLSPATNPADWQQWGSPLNNNPLTSRSGIGVDAKGNLLYAAAIGHVDVEQLALALQRAGAVTAMQMDINPFWPILGASRTPLHAPGAFPVQLAYAAHSPTIYETGWERDFFVALAEPDPWGCYWTSPGLSASRSGAQPQPLALAGKRCHPSHHQRRRTTK